VDSTKGKLSELEESRYGRQMLINGWGKEGQLRLKKSKVFIAGAGGLGSPVSIYLAEAGVGKISICDSDRVELSNLNRQILHPESRLDELKAVSAKMTLKSLNHNVEVITHAEHLDKDNFKQIIGQPDLVVDCLDNFETRYLLNDYIIQHDLALIHAAIWGLMGQVTFIKPPETPCLKCFFAAAPPPKEIFPVAGPTAGVIGCLQAMESLKYLVGIGTTLKGVLLIFDGEDIDFTQVDVKRNPNCPACSNHSNH
jgi:adenylyltransferase/sulfurtransferase